MNNILDGLVKIENIMAFLKEIVTPIIVGIMVHFATTCIIKCFPNTNENISKFRKFLHSKGFNIAVRIITVLIVVILLGYNVYNYFSEVNSIESIKLEMTTVPNKTGKNFKISRYEISNSEFLKFVKSNQEWRKDKISKKLCDIEDYLENDWLSPTSYKEKLGNSPVREVSWYAADAFCKWIDGRLPTYEEWKLTVHTVEKHINEKTFDWDNDKPRFNFCDSTCKETHSDKFKSDGVSTIAEVKWNYDKESPIDIRNLRGNVAEWISTTGSQDMAAIVGGSYLLTYAECLTDDVFRIDKKYTAIGTGFRCVMDR